MTSYAQRCRLSVQHVTTTPWSGRTKGFDAVNHLKMVFEPVNLPDWEGLLYRAYIAELLS